MKQGVLRHEIDRKPEASDFAVIEADTPVCLEDGVLVKLEYVSMDPYVGARLRGRHMGESAPEPMRDPVPGHGVGRVVESRSETSGVGDIVHVMEAGWREFAAVPASGARKVDADGVDLSVFLGALGMPGLTGWAGIACLAEAGAGDTVLIDAAAGAVGGTAGQIARARGARVVGIAGGADKCGIVVDRYGFDACVDYRSQGWQARLGEALNGELSVHFENVSTEILSLALSQMKPYGRAVLCGLAAHYQSEHAAPGIPFGLVIGKRATLKGLVVYDFYDRWDEFYAEAVPLVRAGRLSITEDRADGLEAAPAAFERLMNGRNRGKALIAL